MAKKRIINPEDLPIQKREGVSQGELERACVSYMKAGRYDEALDCLENIGVMVSGQRCLETSVLRYRKMLKGYRDTIKALLEKGDNPKDNYERLHRSYVFGGKDSFDDFMIAVEWYREPEEKYWLPRRAQLMTILSAMEMLEYDYLDELYISQPPRTGKTALCTFFLIWIMGRDSERSNLYCSYADAVANAFYDGVLEILADPVTYDVKSVFPKFKVASTDAKEHIMNIGRKKKYASLSCRSLYGALNGMLDCDGYVVGDDLHSGIEEAKNKMLLDKAWQVVSNNLVSRCKEHAKMLWVGTRWSIYDCFARRIELLETSPKFASRRYKIVNVPALDNHDESNFDYMFGVGYTTEAFQRLREGFERTDDLASWSAQYMGAPIERDGAVFSPDDFRYYNGELPPDLEPDRVFMVVDPAWGGGDYVAAPVVHQYDHDLYISSVVYSNADKSVTEPLIVAKAKEEGVSAIYFEATRTTGSYADEVDARLREEGLHLNIVKTVKNWASGVGKQQRIYDKSPDIKERMVFLDGAKRDKQYTRFMQNVFAFTVEGKNKHDDAPDSLAMVMTVVTSAPRTIKVYARRGLF
jgi:predicted phage terminase large subunit-like protein